jgi:hypothetical protein
METLDRITLYRFRVRTAGGREAVSRVIATRKPMVAHLADEDEQEALEAGRQPDRMLANPRWSSDSYEAGDRATLQVDAEGLEGRTVKFVVERRDGEEWVAHETLAAKVANGLAEATLELSRSDGDPEAGPADFRFSCELA